MIMSFDRRGEGWRPYTGSNPHDHHLHLSVAIEQVGYDSTRPWGVMAPRRPAAITRLIRRIRALLKADPNRPGPGRLRRALAALTGKKA
jgi:hypothetical protein